MTAARIVSVVQGPDGHIARVTVERDGKRREVVLSALLREQFDMLDLKRPGTSIVVQRDQLLGLLWSSAMPAPIAAKRRSESGDDEPEGSEEPGNATESAPDSTGESTPDSEPVDSGTEPAPAPAPEPAPEPAEPGSGSGGTGGSEELTTPSNGAGTVIETSLGEIFPEVKEGLELATKPIETGWGNVTLKAKAQVKVTLRHAEAGKDSEGTTKAKVGLDQSQLKLELSNRLETDFGAAKSVDGKFAPVTADFKKGKLKLATGAIEIVFSGGNKVEFELTGAQLSWTAGKVKAEVGVIGVKLEHEVALGDRDLGDGWTAKLSATIQIQLELAPNYPRIARAAGGGGAFFVVAAVATSFLVGIASVAHFVKLWQHLKEHDKVVEEFTERLDAYAEGFTKGLDEAGAGFAATVTEHEDADIGAAWKSGYDAAGRVDKDALEKFQADPDVVAWIEEDPAADSSARFRAVMKAQRADLIAAARTAVRPAIKRSIYERFRADMPGTGSATRGLRDNVFQALYVPASKYHYRTTEVDRALYTLAMADNWLYRSPDAFPIPDHDTPAAEAESRYRELEAKIANRSTESSGGPGGALDTWSHALDAHLANGAAGPAPVQIRAAIITGLIQGRDGAIASVRLSINGRPEEVPVASPAIAALLEDLPLARAGLRVVTAGGRLAGILWVAA